MQGEYTYYINKSDTKQIRPTQCHLLPKRKKEKNYRNQISGIEGNILSPIRKGKWQMGHIVDPNQSNLKTRQEYQKC